ncbi:VCBS repeat-containing protein [Snuella sedimenti]|uniref:VCBS repeat-containing protein n=1 Tax=Snuella sedimenti TaxID=2798802 RepID=A0A8J7IR10_9FLAO|nr:FG-GAP-like repeat-containing protein [Snuella sedimenti]MBJ6369597.1 VCBS repeat-containing protein [Snuella sedimenti]
MNLIFYKHRKVKQFKIWSIYCLFFILSSCNEKKVLINSKEATFELIPASQSGILFNNKIEENYKNFFDNFNYVYNGGGVAIGDINNDGLPDIYFTANDSSNKLYLNKGDFKFEDITKQAGVGGGDGWHNGVVMADVNADGYLDIYICRGGIKSNNSSQRENLLFINQQDNTFIEQASGFGLNDRGYSTHASFFDFDNDNDLDVYITNRPDKFYIGLADILKNKESTHDDYRDKLFENRGGKFYNISKQAGITSNFGFSLSVVTSDVNNDGYIDIFVANDFSENDYLYLNNGDGTFKEKIKEATNHVSFYSMGSDIADMNNDGFEDIFVTEMLPSNYKRSKTSMPPMNIKRFDRLKEKGFHNQYMHNMLHLNRGNSYFSDISQIAGISKTDWSWSCLMVDFNNNGLKDVFVSNGYKRELFDRDSYYKRKELYEKNRGIYTSLEDMSRGLANDIINIYPSQELPNHFYINNGDLTFTNKTQEIGFDIPSFSNGAAVGDLDNDGDLDLVVNNVDKEAFVFKNNLVTNQSYLKIKLLGPKGNTTGLGTKLTLYSNKKKQYQEFKTVRGYLSSVEPIVHFGLGNQKKIDSVKVVWPDGNINMLRNQDANQLLTVAYSNSSLQQKSNSKNKNVKTLFSDQTYNYFQNPFRHKENYFNDYEKQVLLPKKYSINGPYISVGDINNDGLEDFFIGGASNQSGRVYLQNKSKKFIHLKQEAFENDKVFEDMESVFFDADGDGDLDLYVVSGGYEFEPLSTHYQDRLYLNNGKGEYTRSKGLPKINASGGCVSVADYDNDGDLDVFIGGKVVPNYYPFPPKSLLLENDGEGNFTDVTKIKAKALSKVGMVNSSVWADINNDKYPDLILVGEWMPIKFFINNKGQLVDETKKYGLKDTTGWWYKIVATDYDKDGDVDFVVGNLGLNHKFKASNEKPLHIYANDFDVNGSFDAFLAKYNEQGDQVPVRGLDCSSEQIPEIKKKYKTFNEFADASISEILGPGLDNSLHYQAKLFASCILKNDNGTFVLEQLPNEAQLSTIQGIIIEDLDNDGRLDIVAAGNQFETEIETTMADASVGVILKSEKGKYCSLSQLKTGFFVPYNVKDVKRIKLGHDNTLGILVGCNDDVLRLFAKTE